MKFLKNPSTKKSDPNKPSKQDQFFQIYRDIPASKIPSGGVADSVNGLLFGDRIMVKPGDRLLSATTVLPLDATQPFSSGIVKTTSSVTHSGNGFVAGDVGKYLIWDVFPGKDFGRKNDGVLSFDLQLLKICHCAFFGAFH